MPKYHRVFGGDTAAVASQPRVAGGQNVVRVDRPETRSAGRDFRAAGGGAGCGLNPFFWPLGRASARTSCASRALQASLKWSDLMAVESGTGFGAHLCGQRIVGRTDGIAQPGRDRCGSLRSKPRQVAVGPQLSIQCQLDVALPTHTRYLGAKSGSTIGRTCRPIASHLGRPRTRKRRELQALYSLGG